MIFEVLKVSFPISNQICSNLHFGLHMTIPPDFRYFENFCPYFQPNLPQFGISIFERLIELLVKNNQSW